MSPHQWNNNQDIKATALIPELVLFGWTQYKCPCVGDNKSHTTLIGENPCEGILYNSGHTRGPVRDPSLQNSTSRNILFKNSLKSMHISRELLASDFQRSPQLTHYQKISVCSDCLGLHSPVISPAPMDDNTQTLTWQQHFLW